MTDIRKIEKAQRYFTKRLAGLKNKSYSDRLKALKANTVESRLTKADLTMAYKIINKLVEVPREDLFIFKQSSTRSNNNFSISKPTTANTIDRYSFKHRVINPWNLLPNSVAGASSILSFKSQLNKIDISDIQKKSKVLLHVN